jgi:hypothetical protein
MVVWVGFGAAGESLSFGQSTVSRIIARSRPKSSDPAAIETIVRETLSSKDFPYAIDEWGNKVEPTISGGYHGSNKYSIEQIRQSGLPNDGGANLNLSQHVRGHPESGFRGLSPLPGGSGGTGFKTAVEMAGEGGIVIEVQGVPTWATELHAPKAVEGLFIKEAELATLRLVPLNRIVRYGVVEKDPLGRLRVCQWHTLSCE